MRSVLKIGIILERIGRVRRKTQRLHQSPKSKAPLSVLLKAKIGRQSVASGFQRLRIKGFRRMRPEIMVQQSVQFHGVPVAKRARLRKGMPMKKIPRDDN